MEVVRYLNIQVWAFGTFLNPFFVAVSVREGYDRAALQDFDLVSELGLSAYSHPHALGHKGGADYGGLLGLNESNGFVRISVQEVFSEKALCEFPFFREKIPLFEDGVDPSDWGFRFGVFDAVAGGRVVFHHLAGTALSFRVYLIEDGVGCSGHSDVIFIDKLSDCLCVKQCEEERDEVALRAKVDSSAD